jgi:DMSO/TMAO reductase YedYZ molybdopterin-dependent catalytic subunit
MSNPLTRRDAFRLGLAATAALATIPDWATPALAQGEVDVPFTDIPATFNPANPTATTRLLDIRKIDGLVTPREQFFAINHFNRPEIDGAAHRVKFTGLLNKPAEFSMADLRAMKPVEVVAGYECSGNSGRAMQGLSSNGRWTGVRLSELLKKVGVQPSAREVVFFGTDRGKEDVVFRQQTFKVEQQFGRSMTLEHAMNQPLLAYALNGEPLAREQGFPIRLIMPGWYGVANVKWLAEVHVQEERYLGNYQARWYRSLRGVGGTGEESDPQTQWVENEVTHMRVKAVIARVRKAGGSHQVLGFVLNDGTPLKSVEVQIDGGAWQPATLDKTSDKANTQYSWKLFTYRWEGATPGPHTLIARATEISGAVQPTTAELSRKKTFLEDNSQFPRKLTIS